MKVIDLLNKIANGEEIEAKHRLFDLEYENSKEFHIGYSKGIDKFTLGDLIRILNDEVEVIEIKEDKKIEKLEDSYDLYSPNSGYCTEWTITETILKDKINEIIDRLNGDSDE